MTMRITTLILFAAVVIGAGSCGAGGAAALHHGDAATAKTARMPETGSIPEGKYATEEFEPAFSVRIEECGWQEALPEGQSTCSSRRSPPS